MKSGRFNRYLESRKTKGTEPIDSESAVQESNDKKISQDFRGFPGGEVDEKLVNPKTATQKKTAAVDTKDGEKIITEDEKKAAGDEMNK